MNYNEKKFYICKQYLTLILIYFGGNLKVSFNETVRLKTSLFGEESLLSRQKYPSLSN